VVLKNNKEHKGAKITALLWYRDDLFSANDAGSIYITPVRSTSISFFQSTDLLFKADSAVVQLELKIFPDTPDKYQLLVSTWTASTILNVDVPTKQAVRAPIGTKKREGILCFLFLFLFLSLSLSLFLTPLSYA